MNLTPRQLAEIELGQRRTELRRTEEAISQNIPELPKVEQDGLPSVPERVHPSLTPQQRAAIAYLISGRSFTTTSSLVGVDRRTLYTWRRNPAFAKTVDELTSEGLDAVATRARNLLLRSTYKLERALDGTNVFAQAMKIVNSKRVWEIASITPKLSDQADASVENAPEAGGASHSASD